jgi:hypothetical protein
MKQFLVLFIAIALMASCRSTRTISKAVSKKDTTSTPAEVVSNEVDTLQLIRSTLQDIASNEIKYTTFSGKVGVDYRGTDGKNHGVNANIRMYRDSAIWVSANAVLGIEAMRLLITKDSVKLLNKLDKVYTARSISYLQEVTSLPLDLYTLQDMIIGNPVYLDSNVIRYGTGNGFITLLSLGQYFRNLLTLNETDKTLVHSKLDDADPRYARTASLSYSDYDNKRGTRFATKRQIVVSERGRLEIKLDFKNYNLNEGVDFPFSIPKNYKRD